jgi:hypothetical protein
MIFLEKFGYEGLAYCVKIAEDICLDTDGFCESALINRYGDFETDLSFEQVQEMQQYLSNKDSRNRFFFRQTVNTLCYF